MNPTYLSYPCLAWVVSEGGIFLHIKAISVLSKSFEITTGEIAGSLKIVILTMRDSTTWGLTVILDVAHGA